MLCDDLLEYYARQVIIKNIGEGGQARLMKTKIAMVGLGGIANHLLPLLVGAGIKKIIFIDDDIVEKTNLHRQLMFRQHDIGVKKTIAATSYLEKMNEAMAITIYHQKITSIDDKKIFQDVDIICEGSDDFQTKLLCDKISQTINKPIIIGAAAGYDGQVGIFHHSALRYGDIFKHSNAVEVASCASVGIMNSTLAQVSGLMAQLFFDYIFDKKPKTRFFMIDRCQTIELTPNHK
ncbi:MAG: HesA/MoeB/ThiF family protein [Alphaproteobacteria bacterium]